MGVVKLFLLQKRASDLPNAAFKPVKGDSNAFALVNGKKGSKVVLTTWNSGAPLLWLELGKRVLTTSKRQVICKCFHGSLHAHVIVPSSTNSSN